MFIFLNCQSQESEMSIYNYKGPIPPPEELQKKFKNVYSQAPEIIFEMFKKQTDHRINIENIVIKSNTKRVTLASTYHTCPK